MICVCLLSTAKTLLIFLYCGSAHQSGGETAACIFSSCLLELRVDAGSLAMVVDDEDSDVPD